MRLQVIHTEDAAEAYRLAVVGDARGAFNVAAEPVLGGAELADMLRARPLPLPDRLVRWAVAAGWDAHVIPADPHLLDLFLQLPVMDTTRLRTELSWEPRYSAADAVVALLEGLRDGAGEGTPPLAPDRLGRRVREVANGVGQRT